MIHSRTTVDTGLIPVSTCIRIPVINMAQRSVDVAYSNGCAYGSWVGAICIMVGIPLTAAIVYVGMVIIPHM